MQHTVSKVKLDNGIEGLFVDVPSANVTTIDIVFRAGDYLSPPGKTDTAHVMEHLVLGANKTYPSAKEFSKEFTKYGAFAEPLLVAPNKNEPVPKTPAAVLAFFGET